jgi:hypothetical protein
LTNWTGRIIIELKKLKKLHDMFSEIFIKQMNELENQLHSTDGCKNIVFRSIPDVEEFIYEIGHRRLCFTFEEFSEFLRKDNGLSIYRIDEKELEDSIQLYIIKKIT